MTKLDDIEKQIEEQKKFKEATSHLGGNRAKGFGAIADEALEKLGLDKELATLELQKKMERKKINEKQIRSLRNRFSARAVGGALLSENPRGVGLGNDTGLPTKLGTA